jgi:hypothetical protein
MGGRQSWDPIHSPINNEGISRRSDFSIIACILYITAAEHPAEELLNVPIMSKETHPQIEGGKYFVPSTRILFRTKSLSSLQVTIIQKQVVQTCSNSLQVTIIQNKLRVFQSRGKASCMFPLYTLERDGRIWNVPLQPCFRIQVAWFQHSPRNRACVDLCNADSAYPTTKLHHDTKSQLWNKDDFWNAVFIKNPSSLPPWIYISWSSWINASRLLPQRTRSKSVASHMK